MIPETAGLYFAKDRKDGWHNLIVNVQGTAPMLYISHAYDGSANGPRITFPKPFEIAEWGPMILYPGDKIEGGNE